jgi:hypothetical protein
MALGAHEIPILIELRPMQDIVVLDLLVGIKMEPALAALVLRTAVPCKREGLQTTVWELDQVFLQRVVTECVLRFIDREFAVGAVGLDKKLSILAKEARMHAVIVKALVVKVAEHGFVSCVLHGELVLRGLPQVRFGPVTTGAGLAANERRWRNDIQTRPG